MLSALVIAFFHLELINIKSSCPNRSVVYGGAKEGFVALRYVINFADSFSNSVLATTRSCC